MAIAATPIVHGKGLFDLLRQTVPAKGQAVELYRRLLAINGLSGAMNSAGDLDLLGTALSCYFQEFFPEDPVRLCVVRGLECRRIHLSGPAVLEGEAFTPLADSTVGSVIQSGAPLWVRDTHTSRRIRKIPGGKANAFIRSMLIVPFASAGKTVGCLEMTSARPQRFDAMEYHLGLLVASHLTSSIQNILTKEELAKANARLRAHDSRLSELNLKLEQLAHTDEATGLFNKRRLLERLNMEVARARRYGEILSCLMIDIDDFKQINDTYGHQAGDAVLRQTGELLRSSLRVTDFVARYGGEEFTVLLPRTNSAGAHRVAENLRSTFMLHPFVLSNGVVRLTISIGAACCSTFDHLDAPEMILRADNALYHAKRNGKNRTCFTDGLEAPRDESGFCQQHETSLTR